MLHVITPYRKQTGGGVILIGGSGVLVYTGFTRTGPS